MPAGCRRCNPAGEYEGEEPSCFYFFCLRRPAFRSRHLFFYYAADFFPELEKMSFRRKVKAGRKKCFFPLPPPAKDKENQAREES